MKTRPRLSIFLQLALLAGLITALAVILSSSLSYSSGRNLLTEQAVNDIRDKANLRRMEIRDSVLETARGLRSLTTIVGKVIRDDLGLKDRQANEVRAKLVAEIGVNQALSSAWVEGVTP